MGNSFSSSTNVQTWSNEKRLTGGARMQGRRNAMEDFDSHVSAFISPEWDLFVCLDGHGGDATASFVSKRLPEVLATHLTAESSADDIRAALVKTFEEVDANVLLRNEEVRDFSGACCVCAVITQTHFVVAYCGDCVGFLLRVNEGGGHVVQELTRDHEPSVPEERARIEAAGSRVYGDGRMSRVDGDLNVSRAFGDIQFKPRYKRRVYPVSAEDTSLLEAEPKVRLSHKTFAVTAHPDTCVVERTVYDVMLLLGSDGLVDLANGTVTDKSAVPTQMWTSTKTDGHTDASHMAVLACDTAYKAGSADNITALVWLSPLVPAWHQKSALEGWEGYMQGRRAALRAREPRDQEPDPFPAQSVKEEE
jgi:serine/threonine protein phosphatase PrpC